MTSDRDFLILVCTSTKHGPNGSGRRGDCSPNCVKCVAERRLKELDADDQKPDPDRDEMVLALELVREQLMDTRELLSAALSERDEARKERNEYASMYGALYNLINSPQTAEFFEAVRVEKAHQVERWGTEHDAGKRPEDWVALATYLLGKATKAHYDGDQNKLLHHVITLAAVMANWHAAVTGASNRMRPGKGEEQAK